MPYVKLRVWQSRGCTWGSRGLGIWGQTFQHLSDEKIAKIIEQRNFGNTGEQSLFARTVVNDVNKLM